MVRLVWLVAVCPLSSETLQVMPATPVGAPAEEYSAVVPVPVMRACRSRVSYR